MPNELSVLRTEKKLSGKEMVEVVQESYPKFDKTLLSKCENGDAYGIDLRKNAVDALYERFDPDRLTRRKRKQDGHRLTCRISCRLENEDYEKLKLLVTRAGYRTMQELLTSLVLDYIRRESGADVCG